MINTQAHSDANADVLAKVAVVGMAGRYPGARNIEEFWKNLEKGTNCITSFTGKELLACGVDPALIANPNYVKAAGVYENTYLFDAAFFGYTPAEAELIDPQHRVFLECCWEALEHAGYDSWGYEGRIGVFAGSGRTEYLRELLSNPRIRELTDAWALSTYNDKDFLSLRAGYDLNLRGPCITVQTTCSTSLTSITLACQSLLSYQSDIVLAGGVTLSTKERAGYLYQEGGVRSRDGRNRAFDADASGTVGASGVGVVVLKRLEDALAEHDSIHAVILGFGLNNDGASRASFVAPGRDGQAAVIRDALAMAGVNPETIGFVECHGTATRIGDPIEIAALTQAFRSYTSKRNFCAVGSVKSNIGHTDNAAGVAGFTKAVLSLKHKLIPPTTHFRRPNPEIDFANSPFFVNPETQDWKTELPRRAAVTSLGAGGTNAHVILEEAPLLLPSASHRPWHLLVWSAKSSSALQRMSGNLHAHFSKHSEDSIADAEYTLQIGRRTFPYRHFLVCTDHSDAVKKLGQFSALNISNSCSDRGTPPVTFLFPGQGPQYLNMGRELYECESVFHKELALCAEHLKPELGLDICSLLYPKIDHEATARQLDQTQYTTSCLFAVEYALAKLWISWGVKPDCMIGHSIGEYVVACLAGVLSLSDALRLVSTRGRLMQGLPGGSMMAVLMTERDLRLRLESIPGISLAAVNGPSVCVVSGPTDVVIELEKNLTKQEIVCRKLRISHACHSAMMDPILEDFRREVQRTPLHEPQVRYISSLTGNWITPEEATSPDYWVDHLRWTVQFARGLEKLFQEPRRAFLEVGPGRTLSSLVEQHPSRSSDHICVSSLPRPKDDLQTDLELTLTTLGQLWLEGISPDWKAFHAADTCYRIPLPSYPFEGKYYRANETTQREQVESIPASTKPTRMEMPKWFYAPSWRRTAPVNPVQDEDDACWLVFLDSCGLGSELVGSLLGNQKEVFTVSPGTRFEQQSSHAFSISPGRREGYELLVHKLENSGKNHWKIIHLWSVLQEKNNSEELSSMERVLESSFYSLLHLGAVLSERNPDVRVQIQIVSNSLQDVVGEPTFCPTRATLLGPCKAMAIEGSNIQICHADICLQDDPVIRIALIDLLLSEFSPNFADEVIAFRNRCRWTQSFELFEPPAIQQKLRPGGVYLITGGRGGLGLVFAEYFAQQCQAKLALIDDSGFPDKNEWPSWLDKNEECEAICTTIRKLLHLEWLGSEVMICKADVSDLQAMQEALIRIQNRFGAIHGVIHSAGKVANVTMGQLGRKQPSEILAPKVKGTLVLSKLLRDHSLDFFVLCSSANGILGARGHPDYASANAFQDAFAVSRNTFTGTNVYSIGWDRWAEVGMGTKDSSAAPIEVSDWPDSWEILPGEGVQVLRHVLSQTRLPHIAICPIEMHHLVRKLRTKAKKAPPKAESVAGKAAHLHPRPNLPVLYIAPRNEVEQAICSVWQDTFGIEMIGINDSFDQLGGHSLLAIQVAARISKLFGIDFSVAALYKQPTIRGLADAIVQFLLENADQDILAKMIEETEQANNGYSHGGVVIPSK